MCVGDIVADGGGVRANVAKGSNLPVRRGAGE